jgi:hypothetical protein
VCEIECVKVWTTQLQETKKEIIFLCKITPSLIKRKNRACGVITFYVCIFSRCVFELLNSMYKLS